MQYLGMTLSLHVGHTSDMQGKKKIVRLPGASKVPFGQVKK